MQCPHCTAELPDDDLFCEECGRPLAPQPPPICLCGAPEADLDEEGYCLQCGRRCRPAPGDHVEVEVSVNFAAVSDRGRNHHRNEDRVAIADGERKIIVVCDGVSSSTDGQTAAQTASDAITAALAEGADLAEAMQRASSAVSEITYDTRDTAPSTTVVTAVIEGSEIQIAWAGDSRAYWISGEESLQLTMDHSWVNEVVAAGELSYDEASHSPRAHGITRWLGADAPPDAEPSLTTFAVPGPGILLLCTDGLWNYADKVEDLTALVLTAAEESAVETARRLVAFANDQGGHDNISVALLRFAE